MRPSHKRVTDRPLHERVSDCVVGSGIPAEQIAKQANWQLQKLQRLLRGATKLRGTEIETLAKIIDRPVEDLYRGGPVSSRTKARPS